MAGITRNFAKVVNVWLSQRIYQYSTHIQPESLKCISSDSSKGEELETAHEEDQLGDKGNKTNTVKTLENLFKIRRYVAYQIASNHSRLCRASPSLIKDNYQLYKSNGIADEVLLRHPGILSETDLQFKLAAIKRLSLNCKDTIPLINLEDKIFKEFVLKENWLKPREHKITTLAKNLELSIEQACELVVQKPFLCSLSSKKVVANIKLYKDFGISSQDICNDLWALRYSTNVINARLTEAKECKIGLLKTWMVRAQAEIFQNYVKRRSDNKLILGNNSLAEYLSERLECSVGFANYIIHKQPPLKNKSLPKLKDLIDFLYSVGYTPSHICRNTKILCHSLETTKNRLKQLEEIGLKVDSLHMLTKSQKQFTQYYDVMIKKKNIEK